jgi:hypothetical protein
MFLFLQKLKILIKGFSLWGGRRASRWVRQINGAGEASDEEGMAEETAKVGVRTPESPIITDFVKIFMMIHAETVEAECGHHQCINLTAIIGSHVKGF